MSSGNDLLKLFSSDYFGHYGWSGILRGAELYFLPSLVLMLYQLLHKG
jgi:hypothetical protein